MHELAPVMAWLLPRCSRGDNMQSCVVCSCSDWHMFKFSCRVCLVPCTAYALCLLLFLK
jgi:hypothetical protein